MLPAIHNFVFFAILVCRVLTNSGDFFNQFGDCTVEDYAVVCGNQLPKVLPGNITGVIIKDLLQDRINIGTFKHNNWASVTYLDVTLSNNVDFQLHDFNFYALKNLKTLGIHSSELTFSGKKSIFHGLLNLRFLNLSSCFKLTTEELLGNLEALKRLDSLILDQFGTWDARQVIMDNDFLKMISKLKIRKLSLSGCNLYLKPPVNIANLSYSLDVVDSSNITLMDRFHSSDRKQLIAVLSKVKFWNISQIPPRFFPFRYWYLNEEMINPHCSARFNEEYAYLFWQVERLEMNRVFSVIVKVNNSYMDLSECNINLNSWYLRSNNMHYFNVTIKWPKKLNLYEVDFSRNNLEYLSPFAFGSAFSLEKMNLAHNKLYLMASLMEFKHLFSNLKNLWYIDLSSNQLSRLPKTVFAKNLNLNILDLSNNQLVSISFEIRHLIKLQLLNLENNKVHYIDGADFKNLILMLQKMLKPATVSFLHNPIVCTCESVTFLTWLLSYIERSKIQSYVCSLEGKDVPIDSNAVNESEFLCIRTTIVIASVSTGIATLCIICLVTAIVLRRKRQQKKARKKANFLGDFKAGLLQQKFLCFISYSSEDEGNDICNIYENLRQTLQKNTGIEQEVICLGNRHFNLGFPIVDEIIRCISGSCVVAFIVSNNFCESHWCQNELREAYELNKPIILICKEEIDLTLMQPLMLKIFRKFTRAKLVTKGDSQMEIVPGYQQISSSILKLAAMYNENVVIQQQV